MTVRDITKVFNGSLSILVADGAVNSFEDKKYRNLFSAEKIKDRTILNLKIKRIEPIDVDLLLVVVSLLKGGKNYEE